MTEAEKPDDQSAKNTSLSELWHGRNEESRILDVIKLIASRHKDPLYWKIDDAKYSEVD